MNLDPPEIKSTAREIKNENESVDKPNETTTTTQYKYNGFKENGLYPYSKKKYNTSRKKSGLPAFEYKQWDFDALRKIIDKTGEDDDYELDNDINKLSKEILNHG